MNDHVHPIFQHLMAEMGSRGLLPSARPIAPCPLLPASELPADRSDETRDGAFSGV